MVGFPKPKTVKLSPYEKMLERAKNKRIKPVKRPLRKKRVKLLPKNKLIKKADEVFQAWVRRRDAYRGCYANEIPEERGKCKMQFCGCHLFGKGKKAIRYDEFNVHGGCGYHNQIHDHTMRPQPQIMIGWFIRKFGFEKYEELRVRSYEIKEWSRDELNAIIAKYENKDRG